MMSWQCPWGPGSYHIFSSDMVSFQQGEKSVLQKWELISPQTAIAVKDSGEKSADLQFSLQLSRSSQVLLQGQEGKVSQKSTKINTMWERIST